VILLFSTVFFTDLYFYSPQANPGWR